MRIILMHVELGKYVIMLFIVQFAQIQWINIWRRHLCDMFHLEERERPSRVHLTEEQVCPNKSFSDSKCKTTT